MRAFRHLLASAVIALTCAAPSSAADNETWPEIRKHAFGDRAIGEAGQAFSLFAPAQAADAAVVPIDIRFPAPMAAKVKSLTLVIDRNPIPIAATFAFSDAYRTLNVGERTLSTRVRVDSFSKVRAILETTDGQLMMLTKFVAGAGGCTAPSSKDPEEALAGLGEVRVKANMSVPHGEKWRDGTVMIRHPNFTGMQMDPKRGAITPARYVDKLEVRLGDALLFTMTGGISISENPHLRFTYGADTTSERLSITASDTELAKFSGNEVSGGM